MKKVHISFGNEEYYKSLDLLEQTSLEIGKVDQFIRYTQEWLKTTDFWNKNQFILSASFKIFSFTFCIFTK